MARDAGAHAAPAAAVARGTAAAACADLRPANNTHMLLHLYILANVSLIGTFQTNIINYTYIIQDLTAVLITIVILNKRHPTELFTLMTLLQKNKWHDINRSLCNRWYHLPRTQARELTRVMVYLHGVPGAALLGARGRQRGHVDESRRGVLCEGCIGLVLRSVLWRLRVGIRGRRAEPLRLDLEGAE